MFRPKRLRTFYGCDVYNYYDGSYVAQLAVLSSADYLSLNSVDDSHKTATESYADQLVDMGGQGREGDGSVRVLSPLQ